MKRKSIPDHLIVYLMLNAFYFHINYVYLNLTQFNIFNDIIIILDMNSFDLLNNKTIN